MKIELSKKTVCGVERFYAICELSTVMLHLMNRKSFVFDEIAYLMRQKWNIQISEPELKVEKVFLPKLCNKKSIT